MFLRLDWSGSYCWSYQCGGGGGSGGRSGGSDDCGSVGGGGDGGRVGGVGLNLYLVYKQLTPLFCFAWSESEVKSELSEIIIISLDHMIYQKHSTIGFITPVAMFYLWFN